MADLSERRREHDEVQVKKERQREAKEKKKELANLKELTGQKEESLKSIRKNMQEEKDDFESKKNSLLEEIRGLKGQ